MHVALHAGRDVFRAPVGLEALEIEPEPEHALPQVGIVDPAGVGVKRVAHRPEGALAGRRLGGVSQREGPRMLCPQREVPEGDPYRGALKPLVRHRAVRAGELAVEDDERLARLAADVVVVPQAGDGGASQLGHRGSGAGARSARVWTRDGASVGPHEAFPEPYAHRVRVHLLERVQRLDPPPEEVFGFFADVRRLEDITPPLLRFRVLTPPPVVMRPGTQIEFRLHLHGVPLRWVSEIRVWKPPERFEDIQIHGPFASWRHTHEFARAPGGGTLLTDTVGYSIGRGPLGDIAHRLFVRQDLERIFDFRAQAVRQLMAAGASLRRGRGEPVEEDVHPGKLAR